MAIDTGSSRGIGKRTALALARRGAGLVNNAAVTAGYNWSAPPGGIPAPGASR